MEAIREQLERLGLVAKRGCKWCEVSHPLNQCQSPRNASKQGPARLGSYEILDANQIAREGWLDSYTMPARIVAVTDQPLPLTGK